ncbi:MAG: hypothetical protein M3R27_08920 [Bacteroidota bacterium]|nr:hypothetical protein [Bacteroidota bacterium]
MKKRQDTQIETPVIQMNTNRMSERERKNKVEHDKAELKLKELVLDYFREAKDSPADRETIFSKINSQWQIYVNVKNKQQRGITLFGAAFEKHVKYITNLAEKQLEDLHQEQPTLTTNDQKTKSEEDNERS